MSKNVTYQVKKLTWIPREDGTSDLKVETCCGKTWLLKGCYPTAVDRGGSADFVVKFDHIVPKQTEAQEVETKPLFEWIKEVTEMMAKPITVVAPRHKQGDER